MQQQKYRVFRFTDTVDGETFRYKETHEGLKCQQEDGTWTDSWVFISIEEVAILVQEDEVGEWDWEWE